MHICVFGAASNEINMQFIERVEILGEMLAKKGHDLVFGAGASGLMGAAARGFKRGGGKITGVIPEFFKKETIEKIYQDCDKLIYTETMRERKQKMEDDSDAFIIVPGGIGTMEEFFEILTLKQLGRHKKPIALYNINGFYNSVVDAMQKAIDEGFINKECHSLYICTDDINELFEYVEKGEQTAKYTVNELKNG